MKRRHNFINTRKADKNIDSAYDYYESRQKNLGKYFLKKLSNCIISIDINPFTYQIAFEHYRQAKVDTFPFIIVYLVLEDTIIIANVFNTHQNPIKKI